MSIFHSPFRPEELVGGEATELHNELEYRTRMEVHRTAIDDSDRAAARRLTGGKVDIHVDDTDESKQLKISWSYRVKIRQKMERCLLADGMVHLKEDTFSDAQVAQMINTLPELLRYNAADDLVLGYIEGYYQLEAGSHSNDVDEWKEHIDDIIKVIDDRFPGQLESLHSKIQSGTLGNG